LTKEQNILFILANLKTRPSVENSGKSIAAIIIP